MKSFVRRGPESENEYISKTDHDTCDDPGHVYGGWRVWAKYKLW